MNGLNSDEIRELNELKTAGYKISKHIGHKENGEPCSICLLCSTQDIALTSFSADDNKKEAFVFSLCLLCLVKICDPKDSWTRILDRRTDEVLANAHKGKDIL